jgi:ankyrin repeat protein
VNTRDRFGNGALIYAVRGKHLRTAMILLESGADVNQANVSGITSLYEAAGGGDIEIVRLLLHEGADPNALTMQRVSPLSNAVFNKSGDIAMILLQQGARPDIVDATGKSSAVYAAATGETEVLEHILVVTDVPDGFVDARYEHDLTLLMWAAGYGSVGTVRMLVDHEAKPDLVDDRGRTALMISAENGHVDVVRYLLESGADASKHDKDGRTARDLAHLAGQSEITQMLN